jgi:enoyl-CoA hydratase/carnithine racemase
MCVTGRRVGADEARETGLVNVVVEADALRETVQDFVAGVRASVHGAATMTKALLLHARERSYADQLLAERQAQLERIRALAEDSHGSGTHP